jgi:hypothetical protein
VVQEKLQQVSAEIDAKIEAGKYFFTPPDTPASNLAALAPRSAAILRLPPKKRKKAFAKLLEALADEAKQPQYRKAAVRRTKTVFNSRECAP